MNHNPDSPSHLVALTTVGTEEQARQLVRELVDLRVIACATILSGCRSIFRWKETIEDDAETLVLMKTVADRWADLKKEVAGRHPYEVPELLAIPVTDGLSDYLEWVTAETAGGEPLHR